MRSVIVALLGLGLAACTSPIDEVEGYLGHPTADLIVRYGQPTEKKAGKEGEVWTYVRKGTYRRHNPEGQMLLQVPESQIPTPPSGPKPKHYVIERGEPYVYQDYVETRTFTLGPDGKVIGATYKRSWGFERKGY